MEGITVKRERLTLSVPEAAEIIGVSPSKMYEVVKIQGFPLVKLGKRLLVSRKGLERWVEEQAEKGWYI